MRVHVIAVLGRPEDATNYLDAAKEDMSASHFCIPTPFGEAALTYSSDLMVGNRIIDHILEFEDQVEDIVFLSSGITSVRRARLLSEALPLVIGDDDHTINYQIYFVNIEGTEVDIATLRENLSENIEIINVDPNKAGCIRDSLRAMSLYPETPSYGEED